MPAGPMRVILVSTYELGRQPFGLASPAAWLRREGIEVKCVDLAVEDLPEAAISVADVVAFYVPMHTATRLAVPLIDKVRKLNPHAHLCCYGLYAPMNEKYLRALGVETLLGGEFEEGLVRLCDRIHRERSGSVRRNTRSSGRAGAPAKEGQPEPRISLARQRFLVPDRRDLPDLSNYARLHIGEEVRRTVGYVEASRGCKHLCRHCPIVPVYRGTFRIVQRDIVLQDIRQQVAAGAEHITFGDPDFFNGIGHALPLLTALHREYPHLSYDVTIKVEHLLKYAEHLPLLRETGCAFVTTAAESIDDRVLAILDKGHTREDFLQVVRRFRDHGLVLNPTFIPFSPWTTLEGYRELLELLNDLDLVDNVAPIQLAIRLLIPEGSKLLELPEVQARIGPFDAERLSYTWTHADPRVEQLHADIRALVGKGLQRKATRRELFDAIWTQVHRALNRPEPTTDPSYRPPPSTIPYLSEPWYC